MTTSKDQQPDVQVSPGLRKVGYAVVVTALVRVILYFIEVGTGFTVSNHIVADLTLIAIAAGIFFGVRERYQVRINGTTNVTVPPKPPSS